MEVIIDADYQVSADGTIDIDVNKYVDFLKGRKPTWDNLEDYICSLDTDINIELYGENLCVYDIYTHHINSECSDELFELAKKIQSERNETGNK